MLNKVFTSLFLLGTIGLFYFSNFFKFEAFYNSPNYAQTIVNKSFTLGNNLEILGIIVFIGFVFLMGKSFKNN